jgi:hypothetical protein
MKRTNTETRNIDFGSHLTASATWKVSNHNCDMIFDIACNEENSPQKKQLRTTRSPSLSTSCKLSQPSYLQVLGVYDLYLVGIDLRFVTKQGTATIQHQGVSDQVHTMSTHLKAKRGYLPSMLKLVLKKKTHQATCGSKDGGNVQLYSKLGQLICDCEIGDLGKLQAVLQRLDHGYGPV